ncbi:uncharacterized protein LOC108682652 [Hyalella azteca]|uniref:Uncharacterized protein LOC108682652 n=1 Tax=Hyalella azteca TaxID=294128 RepID=A0A979FMW5_HYAAZ|nr:uncharacterized protein LOC108682652 [Hyalella azteca]
MEAPRSKNDTTMFWEAGGGGGTGVGVSATPNGVSGGNRRRKKRPTYGVRTVEITKGKNGFGFTISGQAPCMLSYIVPGSSAERSGLRLGDYLIAVNGQNVSKSTHDDVVRIIGMSKLLKLQIAENYYSDSSDDEYVAVNRQKPKFPNRLRHKQQQTRAERVVRDLQSGAIFSERAAIQLGEAALLSDRDWPESFPSKLPNVYPPPSASIHNAAGQLPDSQSSLLQPPLQCSSPTRRRFMPLAFGDNRQNSNITPTRHFEDQQIDQVARSRQSPVKGEKIVKNKIQFINGQQLMQQHVRPHLPHPTHNRPPRQNLHSHFYQQSCHPHPHHQSLHAPFSPKGYHRQLQSSQQMPPPHPHHTTPLDNDQYQHQTKNQQLVQQMQPHIQVNQGAQTQQIYDKQYHQLMLRHHQQNQHGHTSSALDDVRIITEQEINKILYPTLAELQLKGPPPDLGESLYRAVVGYLGTIEVPKDSQGGSRLTAIKNCIRRLRIEKKVHTLVLMSVFNERVVLTNPHGITLAQYPAERITFCGVYADDKKFFGLVTVHGSSSDEFSDVSNDGKGNGRNEQGVSSSCHVFMVDPSMVEHNDHARRAKTFRIECTTAEDNAPVTHCKEFPDTADPILHTIMSLYRSQPGFNFDNGGNNVGMADDAQMSPQHSNTSSNSSNSDSGIGFRDEGGSHLYRHMDRVFVVEVDDNQRLRIQNYHLVNNSRNNSNSSGANSNNASTNANSRPNNHLDSLQATVDNLRSNINYNLPVMSGSLGSNVLAGDASDSGLRTGNSNTNPRTNSAERNASCSNKVNYRAINARDRLQMCDPKCAKSSLDSDIAIVPSDNFRLNGTEHSCDRDSIAGNCAMGDDKDIDISASHSCNNNLSDYMKIGATDSYRRKCSRPRACASTSEAPTTDGRSSITDELHASALAMARAENRSAQGVDGRTSVSDEKMRGCRTPAIEGSSPSDVERLTVRAMPDPVGIERAAAPVCETDPHINSMRHSMHKYLQHKQQHLVKVSQKINRRESDTDGIHPLSVRAFSPANVKKKSTTPTPNSAATQNSLDLELSLKLSPKVYGLPVACLTSSSRPNAPSERSFSRSLEDLRDSSASDGVNGSVGAQRGSFRDGSESDQGLDKIRPCPLPSRLPLNRYLHASETNLSSCSHSHHHTPHYSHDAPRGAFRAVPPRAPPRPPSDFGVARLTGTRPCGIASIDQIINGVARMGAARSTLCAPQCGTDVKTTHTPSTCASPALHDSDMGPPLTTTILKSVNTDSFKRSNAKAMGLESDKYSESILDPNGSSYERTSNALVPYESQHASAIPVVTSSFSDGTNNQEMSTVIPNSSNYSDENSREFYDDPNEVPAQEEYVLESDLDEQVRLRGGLELSLSQAFTAFVSI